MISPPALTVALFVLSAGLILLLVLRPALTANNNGKILAFVALFALPVLCSFVGTSQEMDRSKQTTFCLSCHIMEPYGRSLHVDDAKYVPAAHFQNHRIPTEQACYTCHEDYVLYGGIRAKWRGLHHVYVQYLGTPMNLRFSSMCPTTIGNVCTAILARDRFEASPTHTALHADLVSNQMSCLTSGLPRHRTQRCRPR